MIPLRLGLYAAAAASILVAVFGYGHHQKQQGLAEGKATLDAYIAKQTADTLQASLANQETSLLKQKAVDRSRQDDYENAQKLAAANVNLLGAVAGLRDTIAALDHPAKAGDATEARAGTDDAAKVARELLGECAIRHYDLAKEAGELAAQVIGLQGYVKSID